MNSLVVKVGGSLFDLPDLGSRLKAFLAQFKSPVLIVPGGGSSADVVRDLDLVHRLGEEASHWLALRACTVNGYFLSRLLGGVPVVADVANPPAIAVVDLYAFAADDEQRPDHWPHRWDVTSDSMAVRVAMVARAAGLILLKSSCLPASIDWDVLAANGAVDPYFPTALRRTGGLSVRAVNLRAVASFQDQPEPNATAT